MKESKRKTERKRKVEKRQKKKERQSGNSEGQTQQWKKS